MIIKRTSPLTGKSHEKDIDIHPEQYKKWQEGMLIQEAMPDVDIHDREFIISGITKEEWDELYNEEE
jgi:hypothetical protein